MPRVNLIVFEPAALAVNAYGPYDDAVPEESVVRVRQPMSGFDFRQFLGVSPRWSCRSDPLQLSSLSASFTRAWLRMAFPTLNAAAGRLVVARSGANVVRPALRCSHNLADVLDANPKRSGRCR